MADLNTEQKSHLSGEQTVPESLRAASPETETTEGAEAAPQPETNLEKKPATSNSVTENFLKKRRPKLIPVIPRDEVTVKIEKILEDGFADDFQRLSPIAKQEFKLKGEAAARNIRDLLKSTHVKVKKVLALIIDWLRLLPGINKFFLEQEAKIKTDRIIALFEQVKNKK